MTSRGLLSITILFFLYGCTADSNHGALQVSDVWTRPFNAETQSTTAIYLAIKNATSEPKTLTGALIEHADTVEIHQSIMNMGIMRMRPTSSIVIAPDSTFLFKPGGHHLMVKQLNRNLAEGDSLSMHLIFEGSLIMTSAVVKWE